MLRSYLTIALRRVRRERSFSAINVVGLAVGMASCLLIVLFVREELAYDRFHERGDRIVRLVRESSALSAAPIGPALASDLAGVEDFVRIVSGLETVIEREDGRAFNESIFAADSTLFDVFSFVLVRGDPDRALRQPDELILSESAAEKYFGFGDPLGRQLQIDAGRPMTMTVTGVMRDMPSESHIQFDILASFRAVEAYSGRTENWTTNWLYTYLLLEEGSDAGKLETALPTFFERHVGSEWTHFRLQRLRDIHLHSAGLAHDIRPHGDFRQVMLFSIIGTLVLLIACINFINLSTARGMRRAAEVGIRKAMGARRAQLARQFMGESLVMTLLAVVLAVVVVAAVLPTFRSFVGSDLPLGAADVVFFAIAATLLIVVAGMAAGGYPALYLSAFNPVTALAKRGTGAAPGGVLRKALVVFQFSVSIFLVVATIVIHQQIDYVRSARLGFDADQTVVLPLGGDLEGKADLVKARAAAIPGVRAVSTAATVPGQPVSDYLYRPEAWDGDQLPIWDTFFIDDAYADVLDLEIIQGRDFDRSRPSDSSAFLLNEAAWDIVRERLADRWDDPIGKNLEFYVPGSEGWEVSKSGPVVGIVGDFHYQSLHSEIAPLVLHMMPNANEVLFVKLGTDKVAQTVDGLRAEWEELAVSSPFQYFFLDDSFDRLYRSEERMGQLAGIFALLALFVACLGLFGLAAYTAERRTKEIGIRKVLGASVASVVRLLSLEFVSLVGVAFAIAIPVSILLVNDWLENFAYHIRLGPGIFLMAGASAFVVALASVGYQAVRAAMKNPVISLRHE